MANTQKRGYLIPDPSESIFPQIRDMIIGIDNDHTWSSYVPVFTGLTVGNGTLTAQWIRTGKLIHVRIHLTLGSTSSVAGAVTITLPITAVAYPGAAGITAIGMVRLFDGTNAFEGPALMFSTTTIRLGVYDSSGTYLKAMDITNAVPFGWASTHQLSAQFSYEST